MTIIDNIRTFFANQSLKKLVKQADKVNRFNYNSCKNVGIVYNADNNAETRAAIELYDKLKSEGKQVSTLGYLNIDRKKTTIHPKLGFDYFYKSDLDWKLFPKNGIVDTFMNTPFGLVIDLTTMPLASIDYVIGHSNATTKAGRLRNNGIVFYDFMIGGLPNENIDTFAAQLIHYLKLLNN
ncbi:MAG: hypothetical protein M0D57_17285 [Sphingobacteriales bacterium JAD_PAG50586_3]|nr:MAG: hypothetical protein M0D57_17285 [Sphingobacteriales bacterium JAD_PAG50586_3]